MSFLKNTLNFASYSYNASTNIPTLASMKDGTIFEVAVAGLQTVGGTSSYCAVNDSLVYKNGGVEFLSKVTVKLNATTMKPDGHATLVVTMAQLAQDGRIVRISVAGTIAVIGDVNIDDTLIYIGGNWKIIPIKAVLADISDTLPLDNKFMTDEHLVDWFTSAGRVDAVGGAVPGDSSVIVQVLPGGKKLVAVKVVNPALAANQTALAKIYNFPVGRFTNTPRICIVAPTCYNSGLVFSAAASIQGITATQITTSWGNPNATAFGGSQVSLTVLLFGN